MDNVNANEGLIVSLRRLADFLEQKPQPELYMIGPIRYVASKEELAKAVKEVGGKLTKEVSYWNFDMVKDLGALKFHIRASRDDVCTKVVKGTRTIPEVPYQPERVVEDVEWVCPEVLMVDSAMDAA